jgi:3-oxoacyl-[acyl-carrier protein] reductase
MVTSLGEIPAARVAIVTGGSRGVGRETINRLSTRGFAVVVNYAHDQRPVESAVEAVLARNGAAVAIRADIGDDLDVERLFAETIETFGGVDAVVHAVRGQVGATTVAGVDLEELDALWGMTARATVIINREAARQLRNGGAIVNMSGSVTAPALSAYDVYAAMTAAVDTLTGVLARELLERDITVNAVALDIDKPCAPGTVADVIAYLLSDEGHAITGQVIHVDNRGTSPKLPRS